MAMMTFKFWGIFVCVVSIAISAFFGHALRFYHGDILAIQLGPLRLALLQLGLPRLGFPRPATQNFADEVPLIYPPLDETVDSLRLLHPMPSSAHKLSIVLLNLQLSPRS
jgi:hypothetical protein